jgi:hypothetical protein
MIRFSSTIMFSAIACALVFAPGCASPKGETPQAKRDYALAMKDRALEQVYSKKPEARQDVESSPGYLVVDGLSWGFGFLGSGGGYGVAVLSRWPVVGTDNERLPQYATEAVLRHRLSQLPNVETIYGWSASGIAQDAEGVQVTIAERNSDRERVLRADYVVGCYGSRSLVR